MPITCTLYLDEANETSLNNPMIDCCWYAIQMFFLSLRLDFFDLFSSHGLNRFQCSCNAQSNKFYRHKWRERKKSSAK